MQFVGRKRDETRRAGYWMIVCGIQRSCEQGGMGSCIWCSVAVLGFIVKFESGVLE